MQQVDWQIVTEIREPQNACIHFLNLYLKHMIHFSIQQVHQWLYQQKALDTYGH